MRGSYAIELSIIDEIGKSFTMATRAPPSRRLFRRVAA